MKFEPFPYQRYCIEACLAEPEKGLLLDMGLGKSSIALTVINELKYNRFQIQRCLVIAPKKVAEATWTDERDKWDHLRHLRMHLVLGTQQQRVRALATPGDVWVISRDNVTWLVDYYQNDWPFDMVVVDELSSFKNPSAKRFKSLRLVRPRIKRVIGLTGTPAPNGYIDLWSQIFLLDQGKRLYDTVTAYRERYFDHNEYKHRYELKPGAAEVIDGHLNGLCISMKAEDYLQLPDMLIDDVPVQLTAKAWKAYDTLAKEAVLQVIEEEKSKGVITATTAAVLTGKLLQLCNGAVYDEDGQVQEIHDCKLDALAEVLEQLEGKPVLVFYNFKHDLTRINKLLASKFKHLRVREMKKPEDQVAWNQREVDVLLAHPASAAYGLNLQRGGNHIIWFSLSWSLELYQQANKRLHRQGQEAVVIIHRLLVKGGRDDDVIEALDSKGATQDRLMTSLAAIIDKYRT